MILRAWVALAIAVSMAVHGAAQSHVPTFCGGLPCPRYVESNDTVKSPDFELRSYKEAVWVSTCVPGDWKYHAAVVNASMRLWNYYWGGNREGLRLPETVPLTIEFRSDALLLSNFQYNVSGYIAPRFHHSPPSPLDASVHIVSTNKQDWFVRVFHKRPTQRRALKHHAALMASIDKADECGDGSSVLIANYDHPHHHPGQRRHRHSEVWVRRVPCSSFRAL